MIGRANQVAVIAALCLGGAGCLKETGEPVGSVAQGVTAGDPLTNDQAAAAARAACAGDHGSKGQCMQCITQALNALKAAGQITGAQHGALVSGFANGTLAGGGCGSGCIAAACQPGQCGSVSDGCGGTLDCGPCGPPPCVCAAGQDYGTFTLGSDPGLFVRGTDGLVECVCTDGELVVLCRGDVGYFGATKAGVVRLTEAQVNDYLARNVTPSFPSVHNCNDVVGIPFH